MTNARQKGRMDVDYSYQWIRVDSDGVSNPTDIGTDSATYTLVAADRGKKIRSPSRSTMTTATRKNVPAPSPHVTD